MRKRYGCESANSRTEVAKLNSQGSGQSKLGQIMLRTLHDIVWFQKMSIPPPRNVIGVSEREEDLKHLSF